MYCTLQFTDHLLVHLSKLSKISSIMNPYSSLLYLHIEASVKMLVYVVNILMMFAGPASCGEVTEVGLAEAAILHSVKTNSNVCSLLSTFPVSLFT